MAIAVPASVAPAGPAVAKYCVMPDPEAIQDWVLGALWQWDELAIGRSAKGTVRAHGCFGEQEDQVDAILNGSRS